MSNKSKALFFPGAGGGPGDFWAQSAAFEGSVPSLADLATMLINIPVPAGVNVGFAIMINVLGLDPTGIATSLQRYGYAANRDGGGALLASGFGSGCEAVRMLPVASGTQQPVFDPNLSAVNADSIDFGFANSSGSPLSVHYQVLISPPLAVTPPPP